MSGTVKAGGSSSSGAWVGTAPDGPRRSELFSRGWTGGVRGERLRHSVDTREAWWGRWVEQDSTEGMVLDLEAGRAEAARNEAEVKARARKARKKSPCGGAATGG